MTNPPRPWRSRMLAFVTYMRSKGHRHTWIHYGQVVQPIGLPLLKFHNNDNDRHERGPTR